MRLKRFGNWSIPDLERSENWEISARTTLQQVVGADGVFDQYGSGAWPLSEGRVRCSFILWGDTKADLAAAWDEMMRALRVGEQKLFAEHVDDEIWTWAKVDGLPSWTRERSHYNHRRVELTFILREPFWYKDRTHVQSIGTSPFTFNVFNDGSAVCRRPVITIKANSATGFRQPRLINQTTGKEFRIMRSSVSANTWVRLDAGRRTVEASENAGLTWVDVRHTLVIPETQVDLFTIAAGMNTVEYSDVISPNITLEISYADTYHV